MGRPHPGGSPAASATQWSLIGAAGDAASPRHEEALEALARRYWYPVYAFARRQGSSPEDACDLTQGFWAGLIERNALARADPARGRFRTFLLTCFKNYLRNEHQRRTTIRRGGGREGIPIDAPSAENRYRIEPATQISPDQLFDRQWALTTLDQALGSVRVEYAAAGKSELHDRLRSLLWEDPQETYAALAARTGMTEAAIKMAVVRLRKRCRQALLDEIARTVGRSEDVEEEYQHLLAALRNSGAAAP